MMLVTGANGMVGSYVKDIFNDEELALTDLPELDIFDNENIIKYFDKYKPSLVLHLAAETDVDRCELEPDHAQKINVEGTRNIALACARHGSMLVHVSTGYVFNGKGRKQHTEYDRTGPVDVYGRTKLEAEKVIAEVLDKYFIFRADWMIGGGAKKDKKFVAKIIEQCKTKKQLEAVDDTFGSPTFAGDFVKGIKAVIRTCGPGLYHLANNGICSRYEMALEIVKILGADIPVKPVPSGRFPLPAPRPQSSALLNYKLNNLGKNPMPDWQASLAGYVRGWK